MLSDIPTLLDDISAGRMVILMDDEDRENDCLLYTSDAADE